MAYSIQKVNIGQYFLAIIWFTFFEFLNTLGDHNSVKETQKLSKRDLKTGSRRYPLTQYFFTRFYVPHTFEMLFILDRSTLYILQLFYSVGYPEGERIVSRLIEYCFFSFIKYQYLHFSTRIYKVHKGTNKYLFIEVYFCLDRYLFN